MAEKKKKFDFHLNNNAGKSSGTATEDALKSLGIDMNDEKNIYEIKIENLVPYHNHTFKVLDDENMDVLVDSIKVSGILMPLIVRKIKNGKYEILAGHRRVHAAKKLGITSVKCLVKDCDDDEADIIMVSTNDQRGEPLPSEKAFSYKRKLDAMKKQGKRSDLFNETTGERSVDEVAAESKDSSTQIHRYIRLTNLVPELLNLIDHGDIALLAGVNLSYLNEADQKLLLNVISKGIGAVTVKQSEGLKKASAKGLTEDKIEEIISGKKVPRKAVPKKKMKFEENAFSKFVPETVKSLPIEKRIRFHERALEVYDDYLKKHPEELENL